MTRFVEHISWKRKLAMPAIVAVVGIAFTWWGVSRTNADARDIRAWLMDLCERAGKGTLALDQVPTANSSLNSSVLTLLAAAGSDWDESVDSLSINVTPGDDPAYGSSNDSATHTAIISSNGVEIAGFRISRPAEKNRPTVIMGYWVP